MVLKVSLNTGINRIRLEFKAFHGSFCVWILDFVLIESDWNLKLEYRLNIAASIAVLIESDWNLKPRGKKWERSSVRVLIESDWNLKSLEADQAAADSSGINRIRLEFKVIFFLPANAEDRVLIESDWNLKEEIVIPIFLTSSRINRIRLEFKGK